MKKTVFSLILTAFTGLSLLAGCAARTGGEPAGQTNRDEVVISISSEPTTLDPCRGWGHGATPLVQSTLVEYDYDMNFVNDLAEEYALSSDGLTWTIALRTDAKFTDGEPVTAADVAFTFNTAKTSQSSLDLTFLDTVEAVDETTVVFTLTKPTSSFLNTVASVGIVPEHAYGPNYGVAPIGSGPYKFVQWNQQEQLILEANEDYYGQVPSIRKVTIVFQDEDAALAAVQAGQVDVALTAATLATTQVAGYTVQSVTSVDNRGITLPVEPDTGKTTQDGYPIGNDVTSCLEIRQAMAYAIDREPGGSGGPQRLCLPLLFGKRRHALEQPGGGDRNRRCLRPEAPVRRRLGRLRRRRHCGKGRGEGGIHLPVRQRRLRPAGRGHGGGGAAPGGRHSDACGGHQLGRHLQAHVLQCRADGLGRRQSLRELLPVPQQLRPPGRLLQPRGLRLGCDRRLPGGRHGGPDHGGGL